MTPMPMRHAVVQVASVIVGERARKDLGDVALLADSIATHGLMQPIVITADHRLVAGGRRLAAVKALGWADIPALVSESATDTLTALRMEREENTCRKDFLPSELATLAALIQGQYKAEAKERQRGALAQGNRTKHGVDSDPQIRIETPSTSGRARDQIAEALGVSGATLDRVKRVMSQGIPELVAAMDAGEIGMNRAATIAGLPQEEQAAALKAPKAPRPRAPKAPEAAPEAAPAGVFHNSGYSAYALGRQCCNAVKLMLLSDPTLPEALDSVAAAIDAKRAAMRTRA